MAFATKYQGTFYDRHGTQWRLQIKQDGYALDPVTIELAKPPVVVDWATDEAFKYAPICESRLEANIVVNTDFDYREFLVRDEDEYRVTLQKYISVSFVDWWYGSLIPDAFIEKYTDTPHVLKIMASDGLSKLKNIPYVSSGYDRRESTVYNTGFDNLLQILCEALARSNVECDVLIDGLLTYESNHSSTDGSGNRLSPLEQTFVRRPVWTNYDKNQDKYFDDCYTVVSEICKLFGARIFQSYDENQGVVAYHIYTFNSFDGTSINRGVYEISTVTYSTEDSITPTEIIGTDTSDPTTLTFPVNRNQEVTFIPAARDVEITFNPKGISDYKFYNLIVGGEFEFSSNDRISDWSSATALKNWTPSVGSAIAREKILVYQNVQPVDGGGFYENRWGVRMDTNYKSPTAPMTLTSGVATVRQSGEAPTNINYLDIAIRSHYIATFAATNPSTLAVSDFLTVPILVVLYIPTKSSPTHTLYLQRNTNGTPFFGPTNPSGGLNVYRIDYDFALYDYHLPTSGNVRFMYRPDAVKEFRIIAPLPTSIGMTTYMNAGDTGEIEVILSQIQNLNTGSNERTINESGGGTTLETIEAVYEYARINPLNDTGQYGSTSIFQIATNSNVKTSVEPIRIETKLGDAADGQGFNIGTLTLAAVSALGSPTGSWVYDGVLGGDGVSILEVLSRLVSKNYNKPALRLTGDYNGGNNILPYKHFQLIDDKPISTPQTYRDMVLMNASYDVQDDIWNCDFWENIDANETPDVELQVTEVTPSTNYPNASTNNNAANQSVDPGFDAGSN